MLAADIEMGMRAWLRTDSTLAAAGLNFYHGLEDDTQALPCVIAHAPGYEEHEIASTNGEVTVWVIVKSGADRARPKQQLEDRRAAHVLLADAVLARLRTFDLAEALNALAVSLGLAYTIYRPRQTAPQYFRGPAQFGIEEGRRNFRTAYQLQFFCCDGQIT